MPTLFVDPRFIDVITCHVCVCVSVFVVYGTINIFTPMTPTLTIQTHSYLLHLMIEFKNHYIQLTALDPA